MKMMFLAPGVFPTLAEARLKSWLFLFSCRRFGDEPRMFGVGAKQFPGYWGQTVNVPLDYLEHHAEDYTHFFHTDAWDALMLAPFAEVQEKYKAMGCPPMLVSSYVDLGNVSNVEERYPGLWPKATPYCYPNVGGVIAEIPLWIETLKRFIKDYSHHGDNCFAWYDGWRDGWFRPMIDSRCEVWNVRTVGNLEMVGEFPRYHNIVTDSLPCVLHMSGGYADPEYGRDEIMLPLAYDLGIVERGKVRKDYFYRR